jgi:hypothetical protein
MQLLSILVSNVLFGSRKEKDSLPVLIVK